MKKLIKLLKNIFNRLRKKTPVKSLYPEHVNIMAGTRISSDTIINDYTYIGYNCTVTRAVIGRYCSVADNVSIGSGEHPLDMISTSTLFCDSPYDLLTKKDCIIGNDVWIGVDCIIRRGVRIGDGAVIGANSFVNHDVPDFAIVAGNPAKIIRYRFSDDMIVKIKETHWWDFEIQVAREIIKKLSSKETR